MNVKAGASFIVRPITHAFVDPVTASRPSNMKFVVKSIRLSSADIWELAESGKLLRHARGALRQLCLEISALQHPLLANHRNIIRLVGFSQDPESHYIFPRLIMEQAEFGSLAEFMRSEIFAKESRVYKDILCADIADGLQAIHACNIVHCDIKPANILICRDEQHRILAKISDFAYALLSPEENQTKYLGTRRWAAPEVIKGGVDLLSIASDIYSFGLVIWYLLLAGEDPFGGIDGESVEAQKHDADSLLATACQQCPQENYTKILHTCLQHSPEARRLAFTSEVRTMLIPPSEQVFSESHPGTSNLSSGETFGDFSLAVSLDPFPSMPLLDKLSILTV